MTTRRRWQHFALHPADCRLCTVIAETPHGAVLTPWWPVMLDGILASAARRRRIGVDHGPDHHIEELPLTCTIPAAGHDPICGSLRGKWVWAATAATCDIDTTDIRYIHKRAISEKQAAKMGVELPQIVDVGRYKPWRIPTVATVCSTLTWRCIGDPDRIRDLLGDVTGLGKRKGIGEGAVTRWEVRDDGPPDWQQIWWTPDGHPARPIPARAADAAGLDDPDLVPHQIRPPYWRPPQTEQTGGGFGRQPREVIAPWTSRSSRCTAA